MVEDEPGLSSEAASSGRAAPAEAEAKAEKAGLAKRIAKVSNSTWARVRAKPWSVVEAFLNTAIWLAIVRVKLSAFEGKGPLYTGDKRIWAAIAESPFFDRLFLLPRRPIVYPLLFKAGLTDPQIISVQVWSTLLSWGLFAYALSRFVPALIRPLVFAATLLFSLVTPVNAWDLLIRSESTSHSLVVLTLACALLFARALTLGRRRAIAWAAATVVAGTACVFARDTNPYIVLLLLPTLAMWVWAVQRRATVSRRALLTMTLCVTLMLTGASYTARWTARAAPRFDFPLMNVIFTRILPNPVKRDYFVRELGMPMSRALMSHKGRFASAQGRRAYVEPSLHPFRVWLFTDGYSAYERYLLANFGAALNEALDEFPRVAGYRPTREGISSSTSLTPLADEWLVSGRLAQSPLVACGVFSVVGLLASFLRSAKTRVLGGLLAFLVLATVSQLFVCVHGDSMELYRHAVSVGILLRFALLVCGTIGASWVVSIVASLVRWARRKLAARVAAERRSSPEVATP